MKKTLKEKVYRLFIFTTLILVVMGSSSLVFAESRTDTNLATLTLEATGGAVLTPSFSPSQTNYTAKVYSVIGDVNITVLPASSASLVTINNKDFDKGGVPYHAKVVPGDNKIDITVIAQDGTSKTYTLNIVRENIKAVIDQFQRLAYTDPETGKTMQYRLFVPEDYDPNKSYPLVFFLHGAGGRASDNEKQLLRYEGATIWARPEEQKLRPCIVLAPQAEVDADGNGGFGVPDTSIKTWVKTPEISEDLKMAMKIMYQVIDKYNVDKNRLYSTGLSQGGFAVWAMNEQYPDLFAAMVPMSAFGDPDQAYKIAKKPIWAFHAVKDQQVPVIYDRKMIQALKACGGNPKYTEYGPEVTFFIPTPHNAYVYGYQTLEMREWLFQQVKK